MRNQPPTSLAWVALATGLLPLLIVNLCYTVSAAAGHIPACIPYLQGCTSISAAGRYGISYFLFKAGMIPAAVLLAAFWLLARRWLLELGDDDGRMTRAMVVTGCISALFLVLYTVFLGSKGDFYNLMRRFGVSIYFSFSYLAQLMLVSRLRKLRDNNGAVMISARLLRALQAITVSLLLIGLASIPISNFIPDKDRPENTVEWIFALLMVSYYFVAWRAWRRTGFGFVTRVSHNQPPLAATDPHRLPGSDRQ